MFQTQMCVVGPVTPLFTCYQDQQSFKVHLIGPNSAKIRIYHAQNPKYPDISLDQALQEVVQQLLAEGWVHYETCLGIDSRSEKGVYHYFARETSSP